MADREKVINGLNCCCHTDGSNCAKCPYDNADEDCTALMSMDVLELLKEQDNWLGIHQTLDGITFISSGTAKQGEKRGVMLGKALIYERIEKELLYRGLLTNDIRSALVKVWEELE